MVKPIDYYFCVLNSSAEDFEKFGIKSYVVITQSSHWRDNSTKTQTNLGQHLRFVLPDYLHEEVEGVFSSDRDVHSTRSDMLGAAFSENEAYSEYCAKNLFLMLQEGFKVYS